MSEIEQLKTRIDNAGMIGLKTSHIRDDYEPVGDLMIRQLLDSGQYISRKTGSTYDKQWHIFNKRNDPGF